MKTLIAILIALFAVSAIAVNPGTIVGLRAPILNQIKNQYYDIIVLGFQFLTMGDFQDTAQGGRVEVTGISPTLNLKGKDHVEIGFAQERSALKVTVANAGLSVHLNWKDDTTSKTGVADIKGTIANITMFMTFDATNMGNNTYRPKISFNEVNINHNESDFTFDYACGDCSEDVHTRIDHALKTKLFNQIESEAVNIVNQRISTIVNLQLDTMYPQTFPLSSEISIDVGNTGVIEVRKDFVAVPIDSTIFLNSVGYHRPTTAPAIDVVHPENPGEVLVFTSDYVYKCISNIMNQHPMHFEYPVYGVTVQIDIDGTRIPFELESEVGNMRLLAGGIFTIPLWNSRVEFAINTRVDLDLKGGSSLAMVYMTPKFIQAKFSTLKLNIFGFNIDLMNSVVPYIDLVIEKLLNVFFLPQFAIPKLDALPIRTNQAQLEFFEEFTELGFSFIYDN